MFPRGLTGRAGRGDFMDLDFIRLLEELKNDELAGSLSADFDDRVMRSVGQLPLPGRRPKTLSRIAERIKEILSFFSSADAPLRAVSFALVSVAAVAVIAVVAPRRISDRPVMFEIDMPHAQNVALTGDFNDWDLPGIELSRDKNGRWSKKLKLPPGRYRYVLVVDDKLMPDPSAGEFVPDGFGAQNAVLDTERPALRM